MIVQFPLHLLKQAAKRSADIDRREAEAIASEFASEITGIKAVYGHPKFIEDNTYEEDASRGQRLD